MHLDGTATFAEYIAAIESISYLSTDEAPAPGPRSVTLTVHDIFDDSNSVSRVVNVVPENDLPVAAGTTQPASFEGRMFHIQPDVVLSDKDNATLVEATLEIVSGCDPVDTLRYSTDENLPTANIERRGGVCVDAHIVVPLFQKFYAMCCSFLAVLFFL